MRRKPCMRPALLALSLLFANAVSALELEDCRVSLGASFQGVEARCATMDRPLDPSLPDGESITLRVVVIPALDLDPLPDPVVPLAGGPGQGAVSLYLSQRSAFEPLRRSRDILLVDQRGTGESTLLSCPIDDEAMQGAYSDEETQKAARECLDALDHDPRFFTTSVAVRDLDAVREALGYPALNLYGVSYGSRVAQHYARRFPETTRSVVLDGVVPPDLPLGPDIALESQRAVDALFARCREDEACNRAFPDLGDDFTALMAALEASPVDVRFKDPATAEAKTESIGHLDVGIAVRLMLYNPQSLALLPLMIHEGANGNLEPFAAAAAMVIDDLDTAIATGMHNAVMCTEDVPFYSAIDRDSLRETYMSDLQVSALQAICSVWPAGFIDDDIRELLSVPAPVLLLSGSIDPITPPEYAERAMLELRNARHLVLENQGHGQLPVGCVPEVVGRFVATASIDDLGEECAKEAFVMPFFVDFAGPTP